ncbi:MAG TPA: hypothetical protein PK093_09045 [Phycisphaerae bacterium]|nr:hypothetical protein [Phycisphaerae bacterium]
MKRSNLMKCGWMTAAAATCLVIGVPSRRGFGSDQAVGANASRPADAELPKDPKGLAQRIAYPPGQTARPTPAEIHRTAMIMVHLGLPTYALALLDAYFQEDPDVPWTAEGRLLAAQALLLQQQLTKESALDDNAPLHLRVEAQLKLLEPADVHIDSGLTALRKEAAQTEDGAARYALLMHRLLVTRAHVLMAKGDTSFRLLGASLTGQLTGGTVDHSALAEYVVAREALYQAMLIERSVEAQALADEIDQRIAWLGARKAFGGHSYFEVPVLFGAPDVQSSGTSPRAKLKKLLDDQGLSNSEKTWREATQANVTRVLEIAKELTTGDALKKKRQNERIDAITRELFELRKEIGGLKSDNAKLIAEQQYRLQEMVFKNAEHMERLNLALKDRRNESVETTQQLAAILKELSAEASRDAIKQFLPNSAAEFLIHVEATPQAASSLINGFESTLSDGNTEELRSALKGLEEQIKTLNSTGQSTIEELDKKREALSHELASARAQVLVEAARVADLAEAEIREEANAAMKAAETQIAKLDERLRGTRGKTGRLLEEAQDAIVKASMDELLAKERIVRDEVARAQKYVDDAMQFINDFQKGATAVEQAIVAAQAAITAAGNIPTGIITGMSNGVFTNASNSMIEASKAGAEVIRHANDVVVTIEDARDRVRRLDSGLRRYKSKLDDIRAKLTKEELKKEVRRITRDGNAEVDEIKALVSQHGFAVRSEMEKIAASRIRSLRHQKDRINAEAEIASSAVQQKQAEFDALMIRRNRHGSRAKYLAGEFDLHYQRLERLRRDIAEIVREKDIYLERSAKTKGEVHRLTDAQLELLNMDERQIYERIEVLEAELERVEKGEGDLAAEVVPIEELVAMASGPPVIGMLREYRADLDRANRHLFDYANWLYRMRGDPDALRWAIVARNSAEASTIYTKLKDVEQRLADRASESNLYMFSVRITPPHTLSLPTSPSDAELRLHSDAAMWDVARVSHQIFFSVMPHLHNPVMRPAARPDEFKWDNWRQYNHTIESPIPGTTIFVPKADLEGGRWSMLLDAFVCPKWKDDRIKDIAVEHLNIGLEPIGPSLSPYGGQLIAFPTRFSSADRTDTDETNPYAIQPSFNEDSIRSQVDKFHHAVLAHYGPVDLIHKRRPARIHPRVHGRGVAGTWMLRLPAGAYPKAKREGRRLPTLDDLEYVTVTFLALRSGTLAKGDEAKVEIAKKTPEIGFAPYRSAEIYLEEKTRAGKSGDTETQAFLHSPAARETRWSLLSQALSQIPTYGQLTNKSAVRDKQEITSEKRTLDAVRQVRLMDPACTLSSTSTSEELIRAQADWVITNEVFGAEVGSAIEMPVRLGAIWNTLRGVLNSQSRPGSSLLSMVKAGHADLDNTVTVLNGVTGEFRMIKDLTSRIDYDLNVAEAQPELLDALRFGLKGLSTNREVRKRLEAYQHRYMFYEEADGWIARWIHDGGEVSASLKRHQVESLLNAVQRGWQDGRIQQARSAPPN